MIIEYAAGKVARSIKESSPSNTASYEVLNYALLLRLNFWFVIVTCAAAGLILGKPLEMAAAMAAFWYLRVSSGGFHFSSMTACWIATSLILIFCTIVPMEKSSIMVINLMSLVLTMTFAARSLDISPQSKKLNWLMSVWMVGTNFLLQSPDIALAFLAQSLLLIRFRR